MKRFSFHLQPLLRLRSHREEEWRRKLGEVSSRCNTIRQNITELQNEERRTSTTYGIEYYRSRELYLGRIRRRVSELEQEFEEAEKERKKVLIEYTRAEREYRVVQTIQEKRLNEYRKNWFKEENKEIDDIVNARVAGGFSD